MKQEITQTNTSLVFSPGLTEAGWKAIGMDVFKRFSSINFYIGDWVLYGEEKGWVKGDMVEDIETKFGLSSGTIANIRSIIKKLNIRNDGLTWSHHRALAMLDRGDQEKFSQDAVDSKWSAKQLSYEVLKHIRHPNAEKHNPSPPEPEEAQVIELERGPGLDPGADVASNQETSRIIVEADKYAEIFLFSVILKDTTVKDLAKYIFQTLSNVEGHDLTGSLIRTINRTRMEAKRNIQESARKEGERQRIRDEKARLEVKEG